MADSSKPTRVYEEEKKTCPNCGEDLPKSTTRCPSCGYVFGQAGGSTGTKKSSKNPWLLGLMALLVILGAFFGLRSFLFAPQPPSVTENTVVKAIQIEPLTHDIEDWDELFTEVWGGLDFLMRPGDVVWGQAFGELKLKKGNDLLKSRPFGPAGLPYTDKDKLWEEMGKESAYKELSKAISTGDSPKEFLPRYYTSECNFASLIGVFSPGLGTGAEGPELCLGKQWGPLQYKMDEEGEFLLGINFVPYPFHHLPLLGSLFVVTKKRQKVESEKSPNIFFKELKRSSEGRFILFVVIHARKGRKLEKVVVNDDSRSVEGNVYKERAEIIPGVGKSQVKIKAINSKNKASKKTFVVDGQVMDQLVERFNRVDFIETG